jgi:hypothetical protein
VVGKLFYQKYIFSTSFILVWGKYLSLPSEYLKRIFSYFFLNINYKNRYEYKRINCFVDTSIITYIIFFYIYEVLKRFVCHNFKVEIREVHIFPIFFNYCTTVKITGLGYRCATTVSFKVTYVV